MKAIRKKSYEAHEIAYQRMRKEGRLVWKGNCKNGKSNRVEINNFLKDCLAQPWMPKSGKVIEFGCGTGPILRRVCKKGFSGVGIDISKTAIMMAREQSKGLGMKFKQGDVCKSNPKTLGKFNIVIDGLCLHCITEDKDRKAYLDNVFEILETGGVFVLLTMCSPVNRKKFSEICKGQKIVKKIIYSPFEDKSYGNLTKFGEKNYLPTRYIGHWKEIFSEIRKAGFELKLVRYNANSCVDMFGTLTVGAMKSAAH